MITFNRLILGLLIIGLAGNTFAYSTERIFKGRSKIEEGHKCSIEIKFSESGKIKSFRTHGPVQMTSKDSFIFVPVDNGSWITNDSIESTLQAPRNKTRSGEHRANITYTSSKNIVTYKSKISTPGGRYKQMNYVFKKRKGSLTSVDIRLKRVGQDITTNKTFTKFQCTNLIEI